jgi:hypothetical protein
MANVRTGLPGGLRDRRPGSLEGPVRDEPMGSGTGPEHGRAIMEARLIPSLLKDLDQERVTE